MSDPNFPEQAGEFGVDAAIDTTADNLINPIFDGVASHVPGAEGFEQMLNTEVDQVINNEINTEVNKGFGGMIQDSENLFNRE
ncbi:MAG: hypothetical protein V7K97_26115 [Nostoc sp.]|uniref:hypothetical protein n=1 Tax=Nostoc sp. TaxID=1180 RepID=UPI002FF84F9D